MDAAETRRILDRLVGWEVSPVLWRKVNRGLAAGRVQSPATRLVVERERERMAFVAASYWDIEALLATHPAFTATLVGVDGTKVATGKDFGDDGRTKGQVVVLTEERANALAEGLAGRDLEVRSVEERPYTSSPKPPFMTSTLQQEGGRKLRLSAQQVMRVAQGLYERGFITYMRTDSVTLSDEALTAVRATVASTYGDRFLSPGPRRYTTKVKNAQEAHEAIRPSTPLRPPDQVAGELRGPDLDLYRLIWQRTLASQMADATGTTVSVRLGAASATPAGSTDCEFAASGTTITFPGYRQAYVESSDDSAGTDAEREALLPALTVGQAVPVESLTPEGPHHRPARPLHRGQPRQAARGAGHRPPLHVGVDHPDHPRPRLRLEEGAGPRADLDGVRGRPPARAALRRARRLHLHGRPGGRPRRHRPRRPGEGRVAAATSTSGPSTRPGSRSWCRTTWTRSTPPRSTRSSSATTPTATRSWSSRASTGPTSSGAMTRPACPSRSRPTS